MTGGRKELHEDETGSSSLWTQALLRQHQKRTHLTPELAIEREMPKSAILALPSTSSTFWGLRSRWITPAAGGSGCRQGGSRVSKNICHETGLGDFLRRYHKVQQTLCATRQRGPSSPSYDSRSCMCWQNVSRQSAAESTQRLLQLFW